MSEKFDFRYRVGCSVFGLVFGLLFGFVVGLGCAAIECAANPLPIAVFGASLVGAIIGFGLPRSVFSLWEISASAWRKASEFFSKNEGLARLLEYLSLAGVVLAIAVILFTRGYL